MIIETNSSINVTTCSSSSQVSSIEFASRVELSCMSSIQLEYISNLDKHISYYLSSTNERGSYFSYLHFLLHDSKIMIRSSYCCNWNLSCCPDCISSARRYSYTKIESGLTRHSRRWWEPRANAWFRWAPNLCTLHMGGPNKLLTYAPIAGRPCSYPLWLLTIKWHYKVVQWTPNHRKFNFLLF